MITLSQATAIDSVSSVTVKLQQGGTIELYTGPQPAFPEDALTTQTLLATFTLPAPAYNVPGMSIDLTEAVAIGNDIAAATPSAAGIAAWARVRDNNGVAVFDGTAGLIGSTAMFRLSSLNVTPAVPISIVLSQYSQPRK